MSYARLRYWWRLWIFGAAAGTAGCAVLLAGCGGAEDAQPAQPAAIPAPTQAADLPATIASERPPWSARGLTSVPNSGGTSPEGELPPAFGGGSPVAPPQDRPLFGPFADALEETSSDTPTRGEGRNPHHGVALPKIGSPENSPHESGSPKPSEASGLRNGADDAAAGEESPPGLGLPLNELRADASEFSQAASEPTDRVAAPPASAFVEVNPTPDHGADTQPGTLSAPASETGQSEATHEEYAPLFVDWPQPEFTLFLTGSMDGYIEPCGCSGLKNQIGGINRQYTLLQQLKKKGYRPVGLNVGGQVKRLGPQANIKFQQIIEALRQMDYQAVALGPMDIGLVNLINEVVTEEPPFVCANVSVLDSNPALRIIDIQDRKVAVTSVLGESMKKKAPRNDDVTLQSATQGLDAVWPKIAAARADLNVLLAHASLEESKELAERYSGFDIVVTAGGFGEPAAVPTRLNGGKTMFVEVGTKGMYVGVVGYFGPERPLKYQKVPLDARFADADEMMGVLAEYQKVLKGAGLSGLGLKPMPHPTGRTFVGSKACQDCHEEDYDIWKKTPHAHALQTLISPPERYSVPRHFDPECIACHVVGWEVKDSQGHASYRPYTSGYLSVEETPKMHDVGCENCHGPGSKHVAIEEGDIIVSDEEEEQARQQLVVTLEQAEDMCKECHDLDNSPDFHKPGAFEKYWKQVEH